MSDCCSGSCSAEGNTDNHLYNLMTQLVEENRGLWRIQKYYQEDSGKCEDCANLWKSMIESKQDNIKSLEAIIKKSMQ